MAKADYFTRISLLLAVSRKRYCSAPCWISNSRWPPSSDSLLTIRGAAALSAAGGEVGSDDDAPVTFGNLVKNNSHSHSEQTLAAIEDHLQQILCEEIQWVTNQIRTIRVTLVKFW